MGMTPSAVAQIGTIDPLTQYAKMVSLRNLQQQTQIGQQQATALGQENQIRGMQVADQQKLRQIATDPSIDWTKPTAFDDYMAKARESGVSPTTLFPMQQSIIDMKQKIASTNATDLDAQIKQQDLWRGKILSIIGIDDPSAKLAALNAMVPAAIQAGIVPRGTSFSQYPGDEALTQVANGLAQGSVLRKEAIDQQNAQARELGAEWKTFAPLGILANVKTGEIKPVAGGTAMTADMMQSKYLAIKQKQELGQTLSPAEAAYAQAYVGMKSITQHVAYALQQSGQPEAVAGLPPAVARTAQAAATKIDQAYSNAAASASDMNDIISLARAGNRLAYSYAPVTGVLTVNTAYGVKRINIQELRSYEGAGSWVDRINAFLGKATSGASIPPNILGDMQSMNQAIAGEARNKYQRDIDNLNQRYGTRFTPSFGQPGGVAPAAPGAPAAPESAGQSGNWFQQFGGIQH